MQNTSKVPMILWYSYTNWI